MFSDAIGYVGGSAGRVRANPWLHNALSQYWAWFTAHTDSRADHDVVLAVFAHKHLVAPSAALSTTHLGARA
eukprot:1902624-Rhodomonas_salina.2